jgi:hypothetical protein
VDFPTPENPAAIVSDDSMPTTLLAADPRNERVALRSDVTAVCVEPPTLAAPPVHGGGGSTRDMPTVLRPLPVARNPDAETLCRPFGVEHDREREPGFESAPETIAPRTERLSTPSEPSELRSGSRPALRRPPSVHEDAAATQRRRASSSPPPAAPVPAALGETTRYLPRPPVAKPLDKLLAPQETLRVVGPTDRQGPRVPTPMPPAPIQSREDNLTRIVVPPPPPPRASVPTPLPSAGASTLVPVAVTRSQPVATVHPGQVNGGRRDAPTAIVRAQPMPLALRLGLGSSAALGLALLLLVLLPRPHAAANVAPPPPRAVEVVGAPPDPAPSPPEAPPEAATERLPSPAPPTSATPSASTSADPAPRHRRHGRAIRRD